MEKLTPMQIAVYAVNCSNSDEYIDEVSKMISFCLIQNKNDVIEKLKILKLFRASSNDSLNAIDECIKIIDKYPYE